MSKGLAILEDLKNAFTGHCRELKCETNYIQVCEHKFSKIEKELKALEIIKEKEVNVYDFKEYESKYEYNKHTKEEFQELTQEEYDLLKEVLSNEA